MAKQNPVEASKTYLKSRQTAYQQTFLAESSAVKAVLKDLEKFCRANETTFNADPRLHALLEGRREVYLRIKNHLEMSFDSLWRKLGEK